MHLRTCLTVLCAFALSACFNFGDDDDDKKEGTTTAEAAEALTKAVSFAGGELIDSVMPDETTTDVSLLSDDGGAITPGESSLMSFDINPGDADVTSALIQFEGSSSYFLIDDSAFGGMLDGGAPGGEADGGSDAGSAGGGTEGHVDLVYSVESNVCKNLCDTVYDIKVIQALKVGKKDITKHQTTTLKLDCTKKGNPDKCGSDKGDGVAKDPEAEALVRSYFALQVSVCECLSMSDTVSSDVGGMCDVGGSDGIDCPIEAFSKHAADIKDQMACAKKFIADQKSCVEESMCVLSDLQTCAITGSSSSGEDPVGGGAASEPSMGGDGGGDAIQAECGAWPDDLQTDLDACDIAQQSMCDDGGSVKPEQVCDGAEDCEDGSDERNCGGIDVEMFYCDETATVAVELAQLCDGTPDCPGEMPLDESVCITCPDKSGIYSVYGHCDGIASCTDGSDEQGCSFSCLDGSGDVPISAVCDLKDDCKDGSDEPAGCSDTAGEFPCGDEAGTFVPVEALCDGNPDCTETQADEASCGNAGIGAGLAGASAGGAAIAGTGAGTSGTAGAGGVPAGAAGADSR